MFLLRVLTGSEKEQEKCQILPDLINQVITIQSFKKLDRSIMIEYSTYWEKNL